MCLIIKKQFAQIHVDERACSKSGKLTKKLVGQWVEQVFQSAVNRLHSGRCVLYVDSWGGHSDEDLYKLESKDVNVKVPFRSPNGRAG